MAEQLFCKQQVVGSSPTVGSIVSPLQFRIRTWRIHLHSLNVWRFDPNSDPNQREKSLSASKRRIHRGRRVLLHVGQHVGVEVEGNRH